MKQPEIDMLVMGSSFGLMAGTWIGYKLRGLRESRRAHDQVESYRQSLRKPQHVAPTHRQAKPMPSFRDAMEFDQALRSGKPLSAIMAQGGPGISKAKVIPLDVAKVEQRIDKVAAVATVSAAKSMEEAMRGMVIEALHGAGYKKSDAATYADACNPADRASLEIWTAAALRRAVLSK